ncbi:MAG TPA: TA system VapC family ribonuclease toxin [Egibacteraceae bacterium]|nr:PIN domain-containing protein [Actinomycetota bacterium]HWB71533.1 TA system VapC family ribonuclease toxin [Egibacteraceae bacterium]
MIAVDTNVLVYAHRRDSDFHEPAAAAVRRLAEGRARWALPWPCLHEFLAIVTHPRVFDPPSPLNAAVDQVDAWVEAPGLTLLGEADDHWEQLRDVLLAARVAGPLVHDGRVAALCRSHGVRELWTVDRDYARFPGVAAVNPLV